MTNDEAIQLLVNIAAYDIDNQRGEKKFEALWMAIKALEQESILNKIRSEILDIYCGQYCENLITASELREQVVEIIDKYSEESENGRNCIR